MCYNKKDWNGNFSGGKDMRKTKIICTIGPACENEEVLTQMCLAGMNVARLNFSHGSHEEHQMKIDLIKKVREKLDRKSVV